MLAVLALLILIPLSAASATTDEAGEHRLTELVGTERARAGVGGLIVAGDLIEVARRHAARMASEGRLYHNPNLGSEVHGWEVVGENVGRGTDPDDIHAAFMESPQHRANIVEPRFTQIGVGVVASRGELWVVEVFRRPSQPPPPPPPPSENPPVVAAAAAPATPASTAPPAPSPPLTTTTTAVTAETAAAPAPLRPPVAGLLAGPPPRSIGEVEVLAVNALAVPIPEIPPVTKLAASLLVAVVAAQLVTLRRLRLV